MANQMCSCGYRNEPESVFCENCGKKIEPLEEVIALDEDSDDETIDLKDSELDRLKVYMADTMNKSNSSIMGKSDAFDIKLGEGEVVIKHYHCSHLKYQRCNGYLTVTNKRVIFRGSGLTSRLVKEITISSITGLDTYYGTNFNFILLLIGLIFGFVFFNSLKNLEYGGMFEYTISLFMFVLSAIFIKLAIKKTFRMGIYSSSSMLSPINIGLGSSGIASIFESNILLASPTHNTDIMMRQLGALIMDVQHQGDFAIEKWKE